MKKIIAWVLVLIVLAGGVYCINKLSYKATPLVQDSINSTDSWKAYTNNKYGFSFRYPQNYILYRENSNGYLAMFRDQSKVFPNPDVHNLIMVGAFPANKEVSFDNYIKKYPKVNGNTNRPFVFTPRVLGKNTFYYTLTERFEGTLSFMYCILNNDTVLCFHSESNGVAWSDENLDVEADSTHVALRNILSTIKFTQRSEQSMIPEIPLNPNTEPFSLWKNYIDSKNNYSISHPAEYHMVFGNSLINYDENKYEMGNPKGVKIQINKLDQSTPIGPIKETKYLGINTEAPGGGFSKYDVIGNDDKVYFRINVWGSENDIHNVINILNSFKFNSATTKPSITVLSPNGGEVFKLGDLVRIKWSDYTDYPKVNIMVVAGKSAEGYYTNSGSMGRTRGYMVYRGQNTGLFDWRIPVVKLENPGVGDYYIRIWPDVDGGQEFVDYSDSFFTIIDSLSITPDRLSEAQKNIYYIESLEAKGFATSTLNWQTIDGKLPPGMFLQKQYVTCLPGGVGSEINSCGDPDKLMFKAQISGRPTQEGVYNFTIKVSNDTQSATKEYSINVKN